MFLFAMLVVGGYAVYVLRPDERRKILAAVVRVLGLAVTRLRSLRTTPEASDEAADARAPVPYLTGGVLVLNLLIFLFALVGSGSLHSPETLLRWGGSLGPLTTNGQWWRLITATFVHAGIVQFIVDTAALAQAGVVVERTFGRVVFAAVYLTSAAFAAALALTGEPLAVSAGASGVVFGMYGLLVALVVRGRLQRPPVAIPRTMLRRMAPAAAVFVVYYMWAGGPPWMSGLATFVVAFGIGLSLTRTLAADKPSALRGLSLAAAALTMALVIVAPLRGTTDARSELTQLIAVEDRTDASYRAATEQFKRGAIKAEALAQLIERSILPELQTLRVRLQAIPGVPRQQRPLLASADEYLRLRCDSWTLRATALHKSSMRMLRDAESQERASLAKLDKIKPALAPMSAPGT